MNLPKEIKDDLEAIDLAVFELAQLSSAFWITGNHDLSEKLSSLRNGLAESRKNIDDAVSRSIHEQFVATQQASANMINAALAVSKLDKEGE